MFIKNTALGLIFAATQFLFAHNANAVTLNEALTLAYKNNSSLLAGREGLKATDEEVSQAFSEWMPSLTTSWERGGQEVSAGGIDSNNIQDTKSVTLSQPIFNGGGSIARIKKAKNEVYSARENLLNIEQDVLLKALTAYMDIVRYQEILKLSQNNKDVLAKHLEVTKERFNLGEVTKTDIAQAEASLARAETDTITSEGNLKSAIASYKHVVGEDPVDIAMPTNPIVIEASLNDLIELSLQNSPSVRSIEHKLESAKNEVSAQRSYLLPVVDISANKTKQQGGGFTGTLDLDTETYKLGVSIPLYQSGSEYSKVRQAKKSASKVRYDLEETKKAVIEAVVSAYQDFEVAKASIVSNKTAIDASEIALDGTQQEAKVGSRTTLDVLDAEQDLFEAKANFISSQVDEVVSSYTILAHVGRLNAQELGLDVNLYNPDEYFDKVKYKIIGF